jgi:hypothetical protein
LIVVINSISTVVGDAVQVSSVSQIIDASGCLKNNNKSLPNLPKELLYFWYVNIITCSFHSGSTNNGDNGIGNARDADSKDRTLGYGAIWILIGINFF